MCLAAFAFGVSEDYPLVFTANRDELHGRPTAAADWWTDYPHILGGRDLAAGGTWLAVDQRGRLAAVTNRPAPRGEVFPKSRGHLVRDFLTAELSPEEFFARLKGQEDRYGPYNLLIFDGLGFHYFSNRTTPQPLAPGTYALSNTELGRRWPKVEFAEAALAAALAAPIVPADLFQILENREVHGAGLRGDIQDRRATVFVADPDFGTRSATVILLSRDGEIQFLERRFSADGTHAGESVHRFRVESEGALEAIR